jgi:ACS family tartrate transporter-like MFS transporter
MISSASGHLVQAVLLFTLFNGLSVAAVPSLWSIPTMLLSDTTAAAVFGLITSFAQIGAFIGPSFVGYLNDKSHSLRFSIAFISSGLFCSALLAPCSMKPCAV